MKSDKRPVTADDLYELQLPADPRISPDGRHVIYALHRVDRASEKKFSNLWLLPAGGGQARQFTVGDHSDTAPRWSPDGGHIAFLSTRADAKQAQIYLIPVDGGEARPLTNLAGRFGSLEWSPDGRRLLYQFRAKDAAQLEREADERKKELGVVARHYDRLDYKRDGDGFATAERWHLWMIEVASGQATQLTEGDRDEIEPTWSPDGQHILFVSNRQPQPDLNPEAKELYLIPAGGGEMALIASHEGDKYLPAFSPDGAAIAYLGLAQRGHWYQNLSLFVVAVSGQAASGPARNLTAAHDLHLESATLGDSAAPPDLSRPTWSADSQRIYCQVSRQGHEEIVAVSAGATGDPAAVTPVVAGPAAAGPFSLDAAGHCLAYRRSDPFDPGQIWLAEAAGDNPRPLTRLNEALLAGRQWGQIEEVRFPAADGYELHGWILKPPGFDPGRKYPSILEIHGGPQMQYGEKFMHEFHFLAARGYVVYWSNPRGGQGYGQAHSGAIFNDWGGVDYDDLMAWADYLEKQPYIDPARMGVTGGSYGGYMTALIIGRTPRFRAAVAQRVVSNPISFYGSSDMNWQLELLMGSRPPWEDFENMWRQAPLRYLGGATTPTLVVHSEQDFRTDREQGEQLFVALRRQGVDAELLLLPEESHGLSRKGRTDRRVARLQHMARWFDKYLKAP